MFEISKNISINLEIFQESKIYIIDNFYQDPDSILRLFLNNVPDLWKKEQTPSYNSIYFEDRRHQLKSDDINKVYNFISFLCNQSPYSNLVLTNAIRFKKNLFNDYKNNYWWPHIDFGYTGIVYFNDSDEVSGTNLYENLNLDNKPSDFPEHIAPWRSKDKYKLIKSLQPKYNRLILFDGLKFFHGMNICNDNYFEDNYRLNQVLFFEQNI